MCARTHHTSRYSASGKLDGMKYQDGAVDNRAQDGILPHGSSVGGFEGGDLGGLLQDVA
jgi:hypothetical protein